MKAAFYVLGLLCSKLASLAGAADTDAPRAILVATPTPNEREASAHEIDSWAQYDALPPHSLFMWRGHTYRKPRNRTAAEIAQGVFPSPSPAPKPSTAEKWDKAYQDLRNWNAFPTVAPTPVPDSQAGRSRESEIATPTSVVPEATGTPQAVTAVAPLETAFALTAIVLGLLVIGYLFVKVLRAAANPQTSASAQSRSGEHRLPPIFDEPEQFREAHEIWERNRDIFATHERLRISALQKKLNESGPVSSFGCLGVIIGAIALGGLYGAGVGWTLVILGGLLVGWLASLEKQSTRRRLEKHVVGRVFSGSV